MNLLITGSAGFIGSHFLKHVLDKPEVNAVVSLDCLTYAGNMANIEKVLHHPKHKFINMNIRDGGGVAGVAKRHKITHCAHLAAETHVDRSISGPSPFVDTNILGTFNMLEAFREATWGFKRFLYASTDEVYGSVQIGMSTEFAPLFPSSPYSASKAAGEMLAMAHYRTYGLPVVVTRSSNNYGTHQFKEKFIPVVCGKLKNNEPIPIYGDGLNQRDWIFVEDNVRALWATLTNGFSGEIYNVSSNRQVSNMDLAIAICDLLGGFESRKLITNVTDRPGHDIRYAPDSSKIRKALGWCELETFVSRLHDTVAWYVHS